MKSVVVTVTMTMTMIEEGLVIPYTRYQIPDTGLNSICLAILALLALT